MATGISWCDETWNPIVGCSKVSSGCAHCYAVNEAQRLSGNPHPQIAAAYAGLVTRHPHGQLDWTGEVRMLPERLTQPLRWKKPRRIFVNSMSDLFHEAVPDAWIDQVLAVMALSARHTYMVLTKRPERMSHYFAQHETWDDHLSEVAFQHLGEEAWAAAGNAITGCLAEGYNVGWPLCNLWLGVSVEDQAAADERIPWLLRTPAALRFVSYEPALEMVDFSSVDFGHGYKGNTLLKGPPFGAAERLDWIIVGGESGRRARPFTTSIATRTIQACQEAGVACFVKQMGSDPRFPHDPTQMLRHRAGADPDEWPAALRVQEFPARKEGEL